MPADPQNLTISAKSPNDKTGFTFGHSQSGGTTLRLYTDLDIPGGPPVRLLHDGELSLEERDQIRANVILARQTNHYAITALPKDVSEIGDGALGLLNHHFGIEPGKVDPYKIAAIYAREHKIKEGLHSEKFEIKLYDADYTSKIELPPDRQTQSDARLGFYSATSPEVEIRLTKSEACNPERGAESLTKAVATNAAGLGDHWNRQRSVRDAPDRLGPNLSKFSKFLGRVNDAPTYAAFNADLGRSRNMELARHSIEEQPKDDLLREKLLNGAPTDPVGSKQIFVDRTTDTPRPSPTSGRGRNRALSRKAEEDWVGGVPPGIAKQNLLRNAALVNR